jgi:hypothetical protein
MDDTYMPDTSEFCKLRVETETVEAAMFSAIRVLMLALLASIVSTTIVEWTTSLAIEDSQ